MTLPAGRIGDSRRALRDAAQPDPEVQAMGVIAGAMDTLDPVAAERVAHWTFARYTAPGGIDDPD